MLVINNGVPKSGTTMFQKILRQIRPLEGPSEDWRNHWSAPSIDKDRLLEYVRGGEWRNKDIIIKHHQAFRNKLAPLIDPDIRILVSYRFIPDAVLSKFYHDVRRNNASLYNKNQWLETEGRKYARNSLAYRASWKGKPNVLMVSYDDTMSNPAPTIKSIAEHLKIKLIDSKLNEIIASSITRLKPGETADLTKHVRSPGVSTSKEEIPDELFAEFCSMEREAEASNEILAHK